ncbi:MAG TPA: DUF5686 family protein, partial [Chitinophagaceae bacterium]
MDSLTHAPLSNVSIGLKGSPRGTLTNATGQFSIDADKSIRSLLVSATGYQPRSIRLAGDSAQELVIYLSKVYTTLKDVIVNAKRAKYRNKNNPAVELIREVIAHKSANGPGAYPYTEYHQYEKIRVLMDRPDVLNGDHHVLKRYQFLFNNVDTTVVPGKTLLPIYLEELFSENYYRRHPEKKKKVITGRKGVNYGEFIDTKAISATLNRMYEDIDIYDNTISVFTMQFVSPVAELAPTFYMYFIQDTVVIDGEKLVQLYFTPRNPEDLLFRGTLYITLDGNYAIRRAELEVGKHINLNYVRNFRVNQDFEKGPENRYHLSASDMVAFFSPFPKSRGFYGERTVSITDVADTTLPDEVLSGLQADTLATAAAQPDSFWTGERRPPLRVSEEKAYTNTDSLLKMPAYHRLMDYITLSTQGYKSMGKFDVGPVSNFYSFNPVEGRRLQLGGRTNVKFSSTWFTDAYVGYGFKDQRWKYSVTESYSLNHQSVYLYPFNFIQASFLHDTKHPGQEDVFAQGNSFLNSFSRGDNSKWLYNNIFRASYVHELANHLSFIAGIKYWEEEPAQSLTYVYEHSPTLFDTVHQIITTQLFVTLRWAPHEQFFQNKVSRRNIINKYPVITFQYARGIQGLFGGQYNYDALHLAVYKRVYLAPFGFSDINIEGGYVSGNLPFPLLIIHPANQSYFYSANSYNLMNIEEFVSDHYAGLRIDHFFNGFFLNKLPLLKKLRLREVIGGKLLYGGVRDENNPAINPNQMKFPLTNGVAAT